MKRLTSEINGQPVVKCDFDNELRWVTVRGGPYSYDHERFLVGPIANELKKYEDQAEERETATFKERLSAWLHSIPTSSQAGHKGKHFWKKSKKKSS